MVGLLPTRLVQTRNVPFGVSTGIILTLSSATSLCTALSIEFAVDEEVSFEHPGNMKVLARSNRAILITNLLSET